MSRLGTPTLVSAPSASKPLLDGVLKKLGVVPNVYRVAALSPAVLEGFLDLSSALSKTLGVRTRERIAIAVAEVNGCEYCLSAHTYLALNPAKITRRMRRPRGKAHPPTRKPAPRSASRSRSPGTGAVSATPTSPR